MEIVTDHASCKPANTQSERLAPPASPRDPLVLVYAQSRLYVQVVKLNMLPEGYGVKMLRTESYAVL